MNSEHAPIGIAAWCVRGPTPACPSKRSRPIEIVLYDDIVSIDLGPVFGEHEADFGRTFVIGEDPDQTRLRDDLPILFRTCRSAYLATPEMSGADLFARVLQECATRGDGFGGAHAGHLVGKFPISNEERDASRNRIRPDNPVPMNAPDWESQTRYWILEIHLLHASGTFGGFTKTG
ncbi:MAG: M24 family metallopeptidase [Polyangiaceae bacterium]